MAYAAMSTAESLPARKNMSRSMPDDTSTKATCGAHAGHPSLNAHETRPAGAALRLSQSSRRWLCDEAPSTVTALGKARPYPRPPAAIARAKAHCCAPDAEGDGRGGIHAVRTMLTASGMRTAKPAPILEDDDGTDAASDRCTASPPLSVPSVLVTLSAFSSAVSSGCWPLQRIPWQALCQRHVAVRLPTALPISIGAAGFAGLSRPQSPAAAITSGRTAPLCCTPAGPERRKRTWRRSAPSRRRCTRRPARPKAP